MERESDDEEVTSAPTVRAPTWDVPPLPPADPPEAAPRAEPSEGHDGDNLLDGPEDDDGALEAAYQQLVEEEEANSRRDRESTFAELTRYFNARSIMKSPEDITRLMDRFGRCCEGDLWGLVAATAHARTLAPSGGSRRCSSFFGRTILRSPGTRQRSTRSSSRSTH